MDFSELKNKRISILITGKDRKKETYSGIVERLDGNFLVVKSLPSESFEIDQFLIRVDIVESVWVYKECPK